jgi:hypothetical protein
LARKSHAYYLRKRWIPRDFGETNSASRCVAEIST